jgi:hypothetical protein
VFAENYRLRSLAETKLFIQENQHLPDVPSAAEMVEKGLDVREMNALLLQKIEELTLHVIALNERVEELEELRDLEELLELEESGSTDSFQEEEVKE